MLVWLDTETTGLNPVENDILELAIIVTDDDLNILGQASWVANHPAEFASDYDQAVQDMHNKNGLWNEANDSRLDAQDIEAAAIEFLQDLGLKPGDVPLAGNTIGFDRGFLGAQMSALAAFFHYRSVDMSSVNELARRWTPALYAARPQGDKAHRAMADALNSIALARHYRCMFTMTEGAIQGFRESE